VVTTVELELVAYSRTASMLILRPVWRGHYRQLRRVRGERFFRVAFSVATTLSTTIEAISSATPA
jgi:hypothetical protein